jgi:hypothetical protein
LSCRNPAQQQASKGGVRGVPARARAREIRDMAYAPGPFLSSTRRRGDVHPLQLLCTFGSATGPLADLRQQQQQHSTHIRPVSSWPWTAAVLVILILLWIKGNFSCNCCLLDEYTYQKRTSTGSTTINFSSVTPISAVSGKQTFREFGT